MNVWPLIQRELQVGARRRSTQWLRVAVAAAATIVGAIYIPMIGRTAMMTPGMYLFLVLVWMAFGITGLFGVFFASDVISGERREGTLGLLFLTRLNGFDVVLGKLFSTSLRATFSLMAAVPVLALPILLGGVTFKAYAHAALVLGNTLFLSVSIGLLVSSFNREPVRAVMGTLLLVLALVGGVFLIDVARAGFNSSLFEPGFSYLSPAFTLHQGVGSSSGSIWLGLGTQHAMAWMFLAIAAWKTGRHTEKIQEKAKARRLRWILSPPDSPSARSLRAHHPVQWLVSHRSRGPTIVALIACVTVGITLAYRSNNAGDEFWIAITSSIVSAVTALFSFVLFIWMTVDAIRRIGDSRTSGALELLLATPLTDREIVSGFWHGIVRVFRIPVVVLLILQIIGLGLTILNWNNIMADTTNSFHNWDYALGQMVGGLSTLLNTIALCGAVIWVGMWLGLKSGSTTASAALTYVMVVIVPGLFIAIGVNVLFFAVQLASGSSMMWINPVASGCARLVVNVTFIIWARRQLIHHFREAANGTLRRHYFKNRVKNPGNPPPLTA